MSSFGMALAAVGAVGSLENPTLPLTHDFWVASIFISQRGGPDPRLGQLLFRLTADQRN